ncbi:hypothetical protein AAZX31_04G032900 [Glycine max]|uniref:Uncharacterized protein n=2 Tax=Glycine subgen. Soja TaxID=1462606 RepID=K7KHV9_SOYBN|nr:hypothetical protein JHK87_008806 [Glycine soja]KAG5048095.1 hypothetical protein JHK85_009198 [Glycine max]KAG5065217.1 hypothetical protein JHK86_008948 [Glycine max]KAH1109565.1 hypothetical protein GYH30_008798 [Glycine max]KAH1252385.1 hypothetical protein GmHk_04G009370 [Glycine max]
MASQLTLQLQLQSRGLVPDLVRFGAFLKHVFALPSLAFKKQISCIRKKKKRNKFQNTGNFKNSEQLSEVLNRRRTKGYIERDTEDMLGILRPGYQTTIEVSSSLSRFMNHEQQWKGACLMVFMRLIACYVRLV